jgi:aspartate/methionine/tyrosine aminotransferase
LNEVVTKKTKIIFFDNPNNPTGALLTGQEMRAICEIAEDSGAYVVCDNALRGSELDGKPALTPFGYYDKAVITGSISKLGATDPRIGWLIASKEFVGECWKFKDYTTLSHSGLGESLAAALLEKETRSKIIKRNLEYSRPNIVAFSKWITDHEETFHCFQPKAGFTAFPRCNAPLTSKRFCEDFLKQERVLISPGEYFGVSEHLRINVGCTREIMTEALKRLDAFVNRLR